MEKTYTYPNVTVTVHGIERWPGERLAPILADYLVAALSGEEEERDT